MSESEASLDMELRPALAQSFDPPFVTPTSPGQWFTVYLTFHLGRGPEDLDLTSLRLNYRLAPVETPVWVDRKGTGELELCIKFDLAQVKDLLGPEAGNRTLTLTGDLTDGTSFRDWATLPVRQTNYLPFLNLLCGD